VHSGSLVHFRVPLYFSSQVDRPMHTGVSPSPYETPITKTRAVDEDGRHCVMAPLTGLAWYDALPIRPVTATCYLHACQSDE